MENTSEILREERDQLKRRNVELMKEIHEKENVIEEMVLKINELKETEMKYLDACEDKGKSKQSSSQFILSFLFLKLLNFCNVPI